MYDTIMVDTHHYIFVKPTDYHTRGNPYVNFGLWVMMTCQWRLGMYVGTLSLYFLLNFAVNLKLTKKRVYKKMNTCKVLGTGLGWVSASMIIS